MEAPNRPGDVYAKAAYAQPFLQSSCMIPSSIEPKSSCQRRLRQLTTGV